MTCHQTGTKRRGSGWGEMSSKGCANTLFNIHLHQLNHKKSAKMRLRIVSTLMAWVMLALVGILPCAAVNIVPYPQSVKMTDAVFNKEKISKVFQIGHAQKKSWD